MSAAEATQLRQLVRQHPGDASMRRRLGNVLQAMGDMQGAATAYRDSLKLEPASVRAHNNLGQVLQALGDRAGAIASYERAIALDESYAIAHNNLGIVYFEDGRHEQAVACYERALKYRPEFAQAHHNCGNALWRLKQREESLAHYDRALSLAPNSAETHSARGNVLQELERFEEALDSYDRALSLRPGQAEILSNSASALFALKRPEEALERSERALAIDPDLATAHSNRAGALRALNRNPEAQLACERALQLKPDLAVAWNNLAHIMVVLERRDQALEYCERAIALQPDLFQAHEQRASILPWQKRLDEAITAYEVLGRSKPGLKYLAGVLRHTRNMACDWRNHAQDTQAISDAVWEGREMVPPFMFLSQTDSPARQLKCAADYATKDILPLARAEALPERSGPAHGRLRVAYLSADFHHHATAMLMAGVFEAHDRERFETIAVSFGPDDKSALRQRLQSSFDRFLEVRPTGDVEVVAMLRELEIDIAVDLKGYTGDMRPCLFTRRCAPVQVSYIGYPGTMALPQMDYILADRIVLPPEHAQYYSEKIAWLPDCYQANDNARRISAHYPTRAEAGLPESGFVFCCFNNNYKITPTVFDVWMRLLLATPGSVLWLLGDNEAAVRNLQQAAIDRGVDPQRLVFAARAQIADHLARHRLADLFLDTLLYNAHTTASDALWAGVPMLTCLGNTFPARVGASLLNAVGLPELITGSLEEYEARALELARDLGQLAVLRARLAANRTTEPLFDTQRTCRNLEAAYTAMWRRHESGLPPESFEVPVC
jgi:protein O-GlcNAc transferase